MADVVKETQKRLDLAKQQAAAVSDIAIGIVVAGSVAYAPNLNVTEKSDLDLLVIAEDLKRAIPYISNDDKERTALANRFFEGYCVKRDVDGVPISLHFLSKDAFDIICKCFVADIRVYRENAKRGSYVLHGFDGQPYEYWINNIHLPDLAGVRTIVPVSFIGQDRYFVGIHRDKLLSNPVILHENEGFVTRGVDKLWSVVVENLRDESMRLYGAVDLAKMSVVNALAKRERMSSDTIQRIKEKTSAYLAML